jgi:hypothetical protein
MVKVTTEEEIRYLRYITITNNNQLAVYVAKNGITESQIEAHFNNIMKDWIISRGMNLVGHWIVRHGDLFSLIVLVNVYNSDWSEIPGIKDIYRSSDGVLMDVRTKSASHTV